MLERALAGFDGRRIPALCAERAAEMPPRLREPDIVAVRLEDANRLVRELRRLFATAVGLVRTAPGALLQCAVQLVAAVAGGSGCFEQAVEQGLCACHLADRPERTTQLPHQLEPSGGVVRRERKRTVEQVDRRRRVVTCERTLPGYAEERRGAIAELASLVVDDPQLRAIAKRLLEVVTHDLVDVAGLARARVRRPIGIALVQPRPQLLRDSRVRGVSDQDVPEAIGILAAGTCGEQVLPR